MNTEPQRIYIVMDYWIDELEKKVYALYIKDNILYLMEQGIKNA